MLFSEPAFLFYFLPAVLLLHWLAPASARNLLLLVSSLLFYAWGEPVRVAILLLSIGWNFVVGLRMAKGETSRWCGVGIAGNLLLLGYYKYAGFLLATLGVQFSEPALPLGISFFTFQAISYLLDVKRAETAVQRNPVTLGLYISLFPQLIAGPIVRYHDVSEQLMERKVERATFMAGVSRFSVGLAKKMLVANSLALPADRIFGLPASELSMGAAWLGLVLYTLQIYFDFSGYSDMAIGLGRMLGIRFLENFNYPYVARSVAAFWRRWHISLSSWLRDYLYIPLGGGRRAPLRVALNLWLVFLLCGLWHGATWNFLVWGAYHGLFLSVERISGWARRLPAAAGHAYLLIVVMLGWVVFRAETLARALDFYAALFGAARTASMPPEVFLVLDSRVWLALVVAAIGSTPLPATAVRRLLSAADRAPVAPALVLRSAWLLGISVLLIASFTFVAADTYNPFIYFRF